MSFASETKKELTQLEVHIEHAKAELAALIRMNGSLSLFNRQFVLNIQTENAAIARRIFVLLKQHYQIESELLVRRKMKLKKNNVYIVRLKQGTKEILSDLGIMENLELITHIPLEIRDNEEKMRSYLRGAFLAGGSVNNPETSRYHLEIYSNYEEHNEDICDMMNAFGLNARMIERRNGFITYLKDKFSLENVAAVIGDEKEISTVALLGGSGADFIYTLPEVDVYLTGDVGYHAALDAIEMKKNIIDIGHYTESLVKDLLLDYISELNVEVIKSRVEKSPFTIL